MMMTISLKAGESEQILGIYQSEESHGISLAESLVSWLQFEEVVIKNMNLNSSICVYKEKAFLQLGLSKLHSMGDYMPEEYYADKQFDDGSLVLHR